MDNTIAKIYQSSKTVLTTKDIALILQETNSDNLKAKISYYVKQKALIRLTRGIFVKSEKYSIRELATSIYSPSYISFETVLRDAGMIFQHYETIFVAGPWSKTVKIANQEFLFRKIKKSILYHSKGIMFQENYSMATPERAFLDTMYLFPNYYFDNLRPLNWNICGELIEIYSNKRMEKQLEKYIKQYAQ